MSQFDRYQLQLFYHKASSSKESLACNSANHFWHVQASLIAQLVKNPPAMQETWVRSLGWEDPLETGKATHSSILAWEIPWTVHRGVAKSLTRLSNIHFHFDHLYLHDYFEFFPVRLGFSMSYLLMREKPSSQLPWLELTAVYFRWLICVSL